MKLYESLGKCENKVLILDGATGTELSKRGMPSGVSPELWILDNPEILVSLQKEYVESGSDILIAPTFGANRIKLEEYGADSRTGAINAELVSLSKKASEGKAAVFGDLAPTGRFVEPFGDLAFEDAVDIFKEQVSSFLKSGVDGIMIETMLDLQETRAALIACRELCDLPVIASMTYDESGRTLNGTDPRSAVVTLQSLGASAIGCNCSTGPSEMTNIISLMKTVATVPLYAKPNAGLPQLEEGKTVFKMTPDTFAKQTCDIIKAGASIVGGCCGTTPLHIKALSENSSSLSAQNSTKNAIAAISSSRQTYEFGNKRCAVIGERINPTGKKALQAELRAGELGIVRTFAIEQQRRGADILDVNMGLSGIDEKSMMLQSIALLSKVTPLPLCIDSTRPEVVEAALRLYPGRALVNSISAEKERIKETLPIAARYGAMFIILPLTDEGIPKTAAERKEIVQYILDAASSYGYKTQDVCVDGLVMTISSDQKAAQTTLELIEWCSNMNLQTVCGLSNVSFGLPQRTWINTAFLSLAISRGLSSAIANPESEEIMSLLQTVNTPH